MSTEAPSYFQKFCRLDIKSGTTASAILLLVKFYTILPWVWFCIPPSLIQSTLRAQKKKGRRKGTASRPYMRSCDWQNSWLWTVCGKAHSPESAWHYLSLQFPSTLQYLPTKEDGHFSTVLGACKHPAHGSKGEIQECPLK